LNGQNKAVEVILRRSFVDKILRRMLISQSWFFFENFFKKQSSSLLDKIGVLELLKEYFRGENNIPQSINFLRGLRNSQHNNGIHKEKRPIVYKEYKLEYNKPVVDATLPFIIRIIRESFYSLKRA
jgi:hypothetical protein